MIMTYSACVSVYTMGQSLKDKDQEVHLAEKKNAHQVRHETISSNEETA